MPNLARALFVCLALLWPATVVQAATASWNANPEPDIAGYVLSYQAATPGVCVNNVPVASATSVDVGNVTSVLVALTPGVQYFFVVRAYNTSGLISPCSNEVGFAVDSGAPAFTTQPGSQTITAGQNTSFTVAANGTPTPTYQWQLSTNGGTTWTNLTNAAPYSGVTTTTLVLTSVPTGLNGNLYRSVAGNSAGVVPSNVVMLTVNSAPTITTAPTDESVTAGQTASFTVAASGTPAPTYQWQASADSGLTWSDLTLLPSAMSATLTLTATDRWNAVEFRCVVTNAAGTTTSTAAQLTVYGTMTVGPTSLTFSATKTAASAALTNLTPAQSTMTVGFTAAATTWTAIPNQTWIQVTDGSGTGASPFTVQIVNPGNVIGASTILQGSITVTAAASDNRPVVIPVTLLVTQTLNEVPFGSLDAPASGTTGVQGSVALSGWALSPLPTAAIDHVEIWRDRISGERTLPYQGGGPGSGKIFVTNAPLIGGARPDIEAQFAGDPRATQAGWGAWVLTRGLSSVGDGSYMLYAIAYDTAGRSAILGTTTITVDNARATQPFGNLDSPSDGATVSGVVAVTGWVLSPGPTCMIAAGDVWMGVDAVPLALVAYGQPRSDIADGFPGFMDSDHAGGSARLDTTTLADGVHQISWAVTDTCGRRGWIGSRFVTVRNASADSAATNTTSQIATLASLASDNVDPIVVQTHNQTQLIYPNAAGVRIVKVDQGDRIDVELPAIGGATYAGFLAVNGTSRALPLGSTLDAANGRLAWEPGAAFLGGYDVVFVATTGDGASHAIRMRVIIGPSVRLQIDQLPPSVQTVQPFELTGFALDLAAADGAGVDAVGVWATPIDGGTSVRTGSAATSEARPDVAATYGEQFRPSGFRFVVDRLPAGTYDVSISIDTGTGIVRSGQVRVTVR